MLYADIQEDKAITKQFLNIEVDMIASFTDLARKKEEEKNYDQLVSYYCKNITQTKTWILIISITNTIEQRIFSNKDAAKIIQILCSEFGIRTCGIQYFKTFSSVPSPQKATKASNVIKLQSNKDCYKTNNENLMCELRSAIDDKTIEYRGLRTGNQNNRKLP